MSLLDIGITDATDKELLEHIDNPRIRKIIEVLQEVDNGVITVALAYGSKGFDTVRKRNLIAFLYNKQFDYNLEYLSDMVILQIDFEEAHSTEEFNPDWGYYSINKYFWGMNIYLNYKDFMKLRGIGCDEILDEAIEYLDLNKRWRWNVFNIFRRSKR